MSKDTPEKNSSIGEMVRKAESDYLRGTTTISKYVNFSMHDTLETIDAYLNSRHTSGEFDSQGREKPFFNIVTAAVNIWFRATDIDRSNIKIRPTKGKDTIDAFLATVHLQDWMRREKFGLFLNDWGRSLARYGSTVVKFVDNSDGLTPLVIPWNRLICDAVDFDANIKIEVLELTEAQLRQRKGYNKDMVGKLCEAIKTRETLDKQKKDTKSDYIKLYEVHGELPLKLLTQKDADEYEYVQQMHVVSFVGQKSEKRGEKDYQDFTLYAGKESKDPYMITHLIREDGRTLSIGAVEHLFQAQWMMNHTAKAIKDQLDLASKLIFQTSDSNFIGKNALTAIENGDILIHAINQPLTEVNNTSHDITSLQNYGGQWKALANEIVGISDAMLGKSAPSGTAWRQVDTLLQESHSLFELMTENKGLDLEQMIRTYVIPHIKTKMDTSEEIAATLSLHDINKIDSKYIKNQSVTRSNRDIVRKVLNNETPTPEEQASLQQQHAQNVQGSLADQGANRFFTPSEISTVTWKAQFKDLEWELEVDVTGENTPSKEDMTTLTTVLQTIASNPRVLTDPNAKLVFNRILSTAGAISPLELTDAAPFTPMPSRRFTEAMDYTDVPEDIKRQMEAQAGFQPSQITTPTQPPTLPAVPSGGSGAGGGGLAVK